MKKTKASLLTTIIVALGLYYCGTSLPPDSTPDNCVPDKHFCHANKIRLCNSRGDASILQADCTLNPTYNVCEYDNKNPPTCTSLSQVCEATIMEPFETTFQYLGPNDPANKGSCNANISDPLYSLIPFNGRFFFYASKKNLETDTTLKYLGLTVQIQNPSAVEIGKTYPLAAREMLPFGIDLTINKKEEGSNSNAGSTNNDDDEFSTTPITFYTNNIPFRLEEELGYSSAGTFTLQKMGKQTGEEWSLEFSGPLFSHSVYSAPDDEIKIIDIDVKASGILAPDREYNMYNF